jgi:deferrochelatase/peroxidase EfeB
MPAVVARQAYDTRSFEPEAFVLRRSMPWADGMRGGLNFVEFGKLFDAFEAQLRRMVGADDDVTDALFKFTLRLPEAISGVRRWRATGSICAHWLFR